MSDITLSAGVRQNLLSLQNTASLLTTTQEHLATGKKVNSAFDNPSSYFTSQSLNNRANSLNSLLDQIGQATQTLQGANQGLTSLTSLLQQALSTAQQALQAPGPSTLSYGAITTNGTLKTAETFGGVTGTFANGGSSVGGSGDTLSIVAGSNTYSVTLAATDSLSAAVNAINASGASGAVTATSVTGGKISITSNLSSTNISVTDATGAVANSASTFGATTAAVAYGASSLGAADTLTIAISGGSTVNLTLAATDSLAFTVNAINASGASGSVTASTTTGGKLVLTADNTNTNFTVTEANTSEPAGFTTPGTATSANVAATAASTDLFQILTAASSPITAGDALTFAVNGGATQQIQFGTSTGQVQTLAQLQTALQGLSGVTSASASGSSVSINVAASNAQNTLTTEASGSANSGTILSELGLTAGTVQGTAVSSGNNTTRSTLQTNYNALLTQIDQLAGDSSYNGVNLLNGDNLQVVFNETNTSSLTIQGVTDDSAGLGLTEISGTGFQSNDTINSTISSINTALSNVQSQTETFGTNASTIQIRQSFTQQLVNVLQTGADNLVLADQNQESANLLTLQTQQQLEISALSIANQANQSVLKLFG